MYNDKVMENFSNPQNVGVLPDANGIGTVGNATCGDIMKMYLKIEGDKIVDAKFQTFGKTLDEALKIKNSDVVEALEGLPPQKIHCSVLAEEAIKLAIENYRNGVKGEGETKEV